MPDNRLVTVVGARPQFIKAAAMSPALARAGIQESIVHTGQHYDYTMSQQFFRELDIPRPVAHLGVGSGPHGRQTGRMMESIESFCLEHRPACMLVFGDTNSTLAAALVAAKMDIPLAHVEAGLRSYNRSMPEEINRLLTDQLSTWLFCPTQLAAENLASEGIKHDGVNVTGDLMLDGLQLAQSRCDSMANPASEVGVGPPYVVATMHRPENTDDPATLRQILLGLARIPMPVILPLHPRTRASLAAMNIELTSLPQQGVYPVQPLSYLAMVKLVSESCAVFTDSGGLQKEAYWMRIPCRTIRRETEWLETLASGWNRLVAARADAIAGAAQDLRQPSACPAVYGDGSTAEKIAAILGPALGIRQ